MTCPNHVFIAPAFDVPWTGSHRRVCSSQVNRPRLSFIALPPPVMLRFLRALLSLPRTSLSPLFLLNNIYPPFSPVFIAPTHLQHYLLRSWIFISRINSCPKRCQNIVVYSSTPHETLGTKLSELKGTSRYDLGDVLFLFILGFVATNLSATGGSGRLACMPLGV
jgi:hypothetical protein